MADTLTLRLLRFLPRNLLSRLFGRWAAWRRPRWLVRRSIAFWVRHFEVDVSEAEHPPASYPSLVSFFTRALKPGCRPIDGDPAALVSPVDGTAGCFGRIERGRLLQAKGMEYSVEALLGSERAARPFRDGSFATFYLSPRDYHRIHAPDAGRVSRTLYEPGTLWPVNPPAVRTIPSLFAVNERVTSVLETARGELAVVMVGATNVGRISLAYSDLVTNAGGRRADLAHDPAVELSRGAHLGTFELGSTVVLLAADPALAWTGLEEGSPVAMGAAIGISGNG